ncbi:MAG: hypothetical protein WA323_26915 [Candidatus Nitrosopolaris sp.]
MSLVKAKKCYHCKVVEDLTNTKLVALQREYDNLQHYLQTKEDLGLYSANKQQANRFYKVIKKHKKYPLSIRNDLIKIEHKPSTVAEYWVRIPVKSVKGGLWIGLIKPYEPIPTHAKICESKLQTNCVFTPRLALYQTINGNWQNENMELCPSLIRDSFNKPVWLL